MRMRLGEDRNRPQARRKRRIFRRKTRLFEAAVARTAYRPVRRSQAQSVRRRAAAAAGQLPAAESRAEVRPERSRTLQWSWLQARWPVFFLVVLLVGTGVYTSVDAKFYVYEAQIAGASHLGTDTIYQAAGVHEQSIFWIDPQQVARDIIRLDGIRSVKVRCRLPAEVRIEVVEREPAVLWRVLAQKRDWWLDEEGVVLPYHGDPNSKGTVFVVDSSERLLRVGDRIGPKGLVGSVLKMASALPGARVFYYQTDRGLSFVQQTSVGQWPVYVGTGEDLEHKIQVVEVLTKHLMANSIRPSYVDVRWADRPLYGMPGADTGGGGQ